MASSKTILLVNDHPRWLKAMTLQLESLGFVIIPAKDGLEALNIARRDRPDIVISDIVMSSINGLELCRCIRSIDLITTLPVILFSNLEMSREDLAQAKACGANAVLPGSPDLSRLLQTIRTLLS